MSRVRGKDTSPEMALRKALFARGFRYRLHDVKLPGKPDIVFRRNKIVIFVHGCFWHGHCCSRFRLPESNRDYWVQKIARNRANDDKNHALLRQMGWRILVVWECAIAKKNERTEVFDQIADWLNAATQKRLT